MEFRVTSMESTGDISKQFQLILTRHVLFLLKEPFSFCCQNIHFTNQHGIKMRFKKIKSIIFLNQEVDPEEDQGALGKSSLSFGNAFCANVTRSGWELHVKKDMYP